MQGIKLNAQLKAYLLSLPMLLLGQQALAHGQAAEMVPLQQAMQAVGASVEHDRYSGIYTISKNSTYVKVKADTSSILVNGQPLNITVPVIEKNGQAYASSTLANEIFQSGLDQTFVAETVPHPLNSLSADEISQVRAIVAADRRAPKALRFSRLALKAPDKYQVWKDVLANKNSKQVREANFSLLQGNQIIEGVVNLKSQKVTAWKVIKDTHGMVLLDDFELVQKVIKESPEFAAALKKRGITDPNKVVATPLTVGYFGGEDGLSKEFNYLKIVSYLDVGDGNYWAHPIENLVAVVDLDQKKVVKVEDGDLVPIPMAARPYDGRDRQTSNTKPLRITEPEGKNFQVSGQYVHWNNWCFHVALDSRVGLQLSTVSYKANVHAPRLDAPKSRHF